MWESNNETETETETASVRKRELPSNALSQSWSSPHRAKKLIVTKRTEESSQQQQLKKKKETRKRKSCQKGNFHSFVLFRLWLILFLANIIAPFSKVNSSES